MSILKLLKKERVFEIVITEDKKALFIERCDEFFAVELNKQQLKMLIEELKEIAKKID